MKIKIAVTLDVDKEQFDRLVQWARDTGYAFDNNPNERLLVKRLLVGKVRDTVYYSHEKVD